MPVSEPGFLGGDRTSIDLPQPEEDLVEAVAATGKPLAVVLMNGSALAVNWINEHANAVRGGLVPGRRGRSRRRRDAERQEQSCGQTAGHVLQGRGSVAELRGLWHGESYVSLLHRQAALSLRLRTELYEVQLQRSEYSQRRPIAAGQPVGADVTVTNTGKLAGDEVVQLYLKFPDIKGAPRIALRGFERVHLDAGASQKVHFDLKPRDMGMVTEDGNPIIAQGEYTISIGGGQPDTAAPVATGQLPR